MSVFKTREYWSVLVGQGEEFDAGCLCVADIDNKGFDKVIVGSYHGYIRIYQPMSSGRPENCNSPDDVVCEVHLSFPILQLEAGHFVSGSEGMHLAILHPRKLAVYGLIAQAGIANHGKQYQLACIYEHKLQRTAFNFCFGQFGGVRGRDFICVQSMDGSISIFEQESFAFCRFLPHALLPGPIKYILRTDSFVTVSSNLQVECYKFHVLASATDDKSQESQNMTTGKRVSADWTFLVNETALDLVVANFISIPLTIFVLGERNLYGLSEAGTLLHFIKMDFNPSCFFPFPAGRGEVLNCTICTHAKTLLVYQNSCLKWSAQMAKVPVQIQIANFRDMKGVIVMLDEDGHLQCSYLGTDPTIFTRPPSEVRELDYASAEQEMQQLQVVIRHQLSKSALPVPSESTLQDDLKMSVLVADSFDSPSLAHDSEVEDSLEVPSVTVTISLQAKSLLQNIKISINVMNPLVVNEAYMVISSVEPGKPVEKKLTVYMKYPFLPPNLNFEAVSVFNNSTGSPRVVRSTARLPLLLIVKPCLPVKNAAHKITIDTNKATVSLTDIFSDVLGESSESSSAAVGLEYYGCGSVITILAAKNSQRYRIQCDEFANIWYLLNDFISRLFSHFKGRAADFSLTYESELPLQEYFDLIDKHNECRINHSNLLKLLEERAAQFRAVQKRLLILCKDKTPSSLNGMEFLLDSTYQQILALADAVDENRHQQELMSSQLSCSTRTITLLLKLKCSGLSLEDFSILDSSLTSIVNDNSVQGWEEMVDSSVTYLLRTSMSKSVKDILVNPAPLAHLPDTEKLKKHVAIFCDRLIKGARLSDREVKVKDIKGKQVTRTSSKVKDMVSTSEQQEEFSVEDSFAGGTSAVDKNKDDSDLNSDSLHVSNIYAEKKKAQLASGDTTSLSVVPKSSEQPETSSGGRFLKKTLDSDNKSTVPDLENLGKEEDSELLKSGQEELIYSL